MSEQDEQTTSEDSGADQQQQSSSEATDTGEEAKEADDGIGVAYDEERPTVAMPGSDGGLTGTVVHKWLEDRGELDDEGNPKFSDEEAKKSTGESQEPTGESQESTD
jgi:hypothetical protein